MAFDSAAFWAEWSASPTGELPGAADPGAFRLLRDAPLHLFGPADWARSYLAMAPWLGHADAAVERLMTAAFSAEPRVRHDAATREQVRTRAAWLVGAVERAGADHADVLAAFLRRLRWHGDDER